jgi:glycerol-3-phosphate acyltransferase PlsX
MWRAGLAMLSGGIGRLKDLTDWQQYGGAPLLGFDRLLIKAHGRSPAHAVQNAIKVAAKTVSTGLVSDITQGLADLAKTDGRCEAPAASSEDGLLAPGL